MSQAPAYRKKLIEVALPLESINVASAKEKMPGIGAHPRGVHLWWARRPLVTCRAVLFSSIVDDPSSLPELFPDEASQEAERERLFNIIRDLVLWENSTNETVLHAARTEIARSTARTQGVELPARLSPAQVRDALAQYAPPVLDPFCGGGSIPLEAQRLGLEAHGSDLNPVAVLITKAQIEIPPLFADQPPVNPEDRRRSAGAAWKGAAGLAADVRYYGKWMRDEAFKRVGHLYPKVTLPPEQGGGEATVIAWLWARTVTCPNPACGAQMPLVRSFSLSSKRGRQAWVEPVVELDEKRVRFEVKTGSGVPREGTVNRQGAVCLVCKSVVPFAAIRMAGSRGEMSAQLLAIVAEGGRNRLYLSPDQEHVSIADSAQPWWKPDAPLPDNTRDIRPQLYGLPTYGDLFTNRQLVALTTLSDLIDQARALIFQAAVEGGFSDDGVPLTSSGTGAQAYADAVATYLACSIDRCTDFNNSLCRWVQSNEKVMNLFARQAIPMVWDFAEANILANVVGGWSTCNDYVSSCIKVLPGATKGNANQLDAANDSFQVATALISTDPPYYDNIGYADLSDFFYVWIRRSLRNTYQAVFSTLTTPKQDELIASPYRHQGSRERADEFFEQSLERVFRQIADRQVKDFPISIYYAFKQSETDGSVVVGGSATASTGWESMLEGMLRAGLSIFGTWPVRSEQSERIIAAGSNALASSIVLVCRPRPNDAPITTRQRFVQELKSELPEALRKLQHGNIAPVDLAQASIGPGMAVFSKYAKVLESSGEPMRVRTALQLINQTLDEVLTEQEGECDSDTQWAIAWYEQYGVNEGQYGVAETLSNAKNTSVSGLAEAGIVRSGAGKVRLLRRDELSDEWDPRRDRRLPVWEVTQRLILALERDGEAGAAALARQVGGLAEVARDLAYRLYVTSERKNRAQEALAYNSLVVAWPAIVAQMSATAEPEQARLV